MLVKLLSLTRTHIHTPHYPSPFSVTGALAAFSPHSQIFFTVQELTPLFPFTLLPDSSFTKAAFPCMLEVRMEPVAIRNKISQLEAGMITDKTFT